MVLLVVWLLSLTLYFEDTVYFVVLRSESSGTVAFSELSLSMARLLLLRFQISTILKTMRLDQKNYCF